MFSTLNVTLTDEPAPTEFYVMFENWKYVADWTLLVLAPKTEVDGAIHVYAKKNADNIMEHEENDESPEVVLEGEIGTLLQGSSTLVNAGTLDVKLSLSTLPTWVKMDFNSTDQASYILRSGETLPIQFEVSTSELAIGTQSNSIAFEVQDADYPDCFYRQPLSIPLSVKVNGISCTGRHTTTDASGNCICDSSSVRIGEQCFGYGALVAIIVLPLVTLVLLALYVYILIRRRKSDSIWEIDPAELDFGSTLEPVQIGEGSFGPVLLADYRGTSVAVKTIRFSSRKKAPSEQNPEDVEEGSTKDFYFEPSTITSATPSSAKAAKALKFNKENFIKEMRLLSKLRHPNVTCLMGAVIKNRSDPMLVLEYTEKGSLFDLLRSNAAFDGEMILSILKDVVQGVRFLHNNKPQVIHGNLKAKNILVDGKYRCKVADFGSCTSAGKYLYWMSPELLREETFATAASDTYALGMVLWEIYSQGAFPYAEEEASFVLQQITDPKVNKRPAFPGTMKSGVASMMHDCFLASPDERPSMNEIALRMNRFKPQDVEHKIQWDVAPDNLGFLNKIFPPHVAQAISDGRTVDPQNYKNASIVYCEIVKFGMLSSQLAPIKVADLLHRLFDQFDALAERNNVMKIELGGGAWMGATNCGRAQDKDHAKRLAKFAIDVVAAAKETLIDEGSPEMGSVQIQVAIHSGPVQAKVVLGRRQPRYSLEGKTIDAVTFLAGSKSQPNSILCSEKTHDLLEEQAPEIPKKCRGRVFVTGMGATTVFWVNQKADQPEIAQSNPH